MEMILSIIDKLPLVTSEKEKLFLELTKSKVLNTKVLQKKAFINLECGKIVILNNVTEKIENYLKQIESLSQEAFIDSKLARKEERKIIKWSDEELEFLKSNHENYTNKELSLKLQKSIYQIQAKKISLKLYPIKQWTIEEIEYLEKNYDKSLYYLSEKLNRSIAAIKAKKSICKKLGGIS